MIVIDYIESGQLCSLKTDVINNDWKRIRSYYNQVSDQSEIYEGAVELPWHSFISNLNILADIASLFNVDFKFSSEAEALLITTSKIRKDISSIDQLRAIDEE